LRHFIAFSLTLTEKLQTWGGKFPFKYINFQDDDIGELIDDMENGRGTFLIASHLGNTELLRGLVSFNRTGVARKVPVTAIFDTKVNKHFTRMMNELNPQSSLDIISAQDIGPQTIILLEERLAAGEIVSSTGDRTSAKKKKKKLMIPFLGEEAPFSSGTFYMAALLKAPVYFIIALRRGDLTLIPHYDMHVHKSSISFGGGKKERQTQTAELLQSYAALLENYCKEKPFQWYNFYNFWAKEA
jgi:predicted LPLAT superfamily acyltransferase